MLSCFLNLRFFGLAFVKIRLLVKLVLILLLYTMEALYLK